MIFVTVGTHEQQFDRLLKKIDEIALKINEEIFVQYGYSSYNFKNISNFKPLISYEEMNNYVDKATIIITHGGPGSIFLPLMKNKKPIVVPRLSYFEEHVDNHQKKFTEKLLSEKKIDAVFEEIDHLEDLIMNRIKNPNLNVFEGNIDSNLNTIIKRLDDILNE